MNAITKDGWVPNAQVVFKSTRKTGDYHGQMDGELFHKWFTDKLLTNIPSNSMKRVFSLAVAEHGAG